MTAPMGNIIPQETALMMPWADRRVRMLVWRVAVEPDLTSKVVMEERSLGLVGCTVGE